MRAQAGRAGEAVLASLIPALLASSPPGSCSYCWAETRSSSTATCSSEACSSGPACRRASFGCHPASDRGRTDRGVQGESLEPRRGRSVPARRRVRCRAGPIARRHAGLELDARRRDGHRGGCRRRLDNHPSGPTSVVRGQRDHHDADDVLHRHRRREHPREGALQDRHRRRSAHGHPSARRPSAPARRHTDQRGNHHRRGRDSDRPSRDDPDLGRLPAEGARRIRARPSTPAFTSNGSRSLPSWSAAAS